MTNFAEFFRYNLWANLALIDFCSQLTDEQLEATTEGVYGNIRDTLMHIFTCEERYAGHLNGQYPEPSLESFPEFVGFPELRRRAQQSGESLITSAEKADLHRVLWLDKGTYAAPPMIIFIQAINHGVDHRSQISTILSLLDIELPGLDGWTYNDEVQELQQAIAQ